MIAFGSQRGNGADLAIHLANAEDNEYVEIADSRGAIAEDLPGMFAEWQLKIDAFTKTKKGFYAMSINPDPAQGPLTREQYFDYIDRAENSLGLIGHDRVVVFHIKEDKTGFLREHCHAVWSLADVQNFRATNIAWDKYKLMAVSREFAHDHGLTLPEGYQTGRAKAQQITLYEKMQMQQNGLSKEERKELITDLWHTSDSPKAFVAALEDSGYMLATGNRPYVLVDTFGNMNSLPKLIDDRAVNTKHLREYFENDFPIETLSTVEHAREMAAKHNDERKQLMLTEKLVEQVEMMKRSQQDRAEKLQAEISATHDKLQKEVDGLQERHNDDLYVQKLNNAQARLEIDFKRAAYKPTGLAAFLSKVSGMDIMRRKLHAHQDRKREVIQDGQRHQLEIQHQEQIRDQQNEHNLQMMELRRRERSQQNIFERESRSIEMAQQRELRAFYSKGYKHMPSVQLALNPPGRGAVPAKAARRYYAPTVKEPNSKHKQSEQQGGNTDTTQIEPKSKDRLSPAPVSEYRLDIQDNTDKRGGGDDYGKRDKTVKPRPSDDWHVPSRNNKDKGRGR